MFFTSSQLFVLAIIFMVVVVPMLVSGRHKKNVKEKAETASLSGDDREVVEEMLDSIDELVERIEVLESILDDTHPKWRKMKDRNRHE